jgi:rhodanese-related sulfurtransferase/sulfur relay (sulfurtransferase) complex TusBCD TusD component (DsrE family)
LKSLVSFSLQNTVQASRTKRQITAYCIPSYSTMCSNSKVNEALQGMTKSGSTDAPTISGPRFLKNPSDYFLVDIREPSEIQEKALTGATADAQVTLGAICHDASALLARNSGDKTMVLICNTGKRAELAAKSILEQSPSSKVAVLQRGMVGLENPAALSPNFMVVFGLGDSPEKLSLALAAVANATEVHENVVLVLMSDGVDWFVKPDSPKATGHTNVEAVNHGEPFKPCKAMLNKFLSMGGVILACTTCINHRGYSFESDMMDCVKNLQMPDLLRMMGEAKGGCLQFM